MGPAHPQPARPPGPHEAAPAGAQPGAQGASDSSRDPGVPGAPGRPAAPGEDGTAPAPPFREALRYWARLGCVNVGGPAAQIGMLHADLVEGKRWIGEGEFLRALNVAMLLPGPEAQQLATYIGWRLHGLRGGLAAGTLFILPGALALLLLAWLAAAHGAVPAVAGLLYGVQPVVVALVAGAVIRLGRRALRHRLLAALAGAAFVAMAVLGVPFPAVVAGAALAALLLSRRVPEAFAAHAAPGPPGPPASWRASVPPVVAYLAALGALLALLVALRGPGDVLVAQALFFTQAAFVTFGGAYAVLAYVAEAAVQDFGWLTAEQMVHGLGLAESTPGPLIMVVQYVGFLGAWTHAGPHDPLLNGIAGAAVTTLVTFLPCFMLVFAVAPHVAWLTAQPRIHAALVGITAAVVGVVAHLAVFVGTRVLLPGMAGLDLLALAAALAAFALVRARAPVLALVGGAMVLGAAWGMAGPGLAAGVVPLPAPWGP